ncbi:hypothetical protein ACLIBH_00665 [Virgibacillus sp. W0430]|uniref:hypothetical protein n=1 Tax=Virgibacillus sp. W0430 TaxID=3391580 RepID=UPI003F47D163
MSNGVIAIVAIASAVMWIAVSRESVKSSKKINWCKLIILLSAGSLSTLVIIFSLFQDLLLVLLTIAFW